LTAPWTPLADLVLSFRGWLVCPNVIPISFEELVGPRGGGDAEVQKRLIWSMQLKLHVPGDPEVYGSQVFNPKSPTFRKGQIRKFKDELTREDYRAVRRLEKARGFVAAYGYSLRRALPPRYAEIFRRRPLKTIPPFESEYLPPPSLVETNYKGFNIVHFRARYFGIATSAGIIDLTTITKDETLDAMQTEKTCVISSTLAEVKCLIDEVVVSNTKLPMLLESGYKDFNIMALRGKFYGIIQSIGDCDLAELSDETLDAMQTEKTCVIGSSMTEIKRLIDEVVAGH